MQPRKRPADTTDGADPSEPAHKRPRAEANAALTPATTAPTTTATTAGTTADTPPATAAPPGSINRHAGRHMPADFGALLGPSPAVAEARDLEDLVSAAPHEAYSDLPEGRRNALQASVLHLAKKVAEAREPTPQQLEGLVARASRLSGQKNTARKSELTGAYRHLVRSGALAPSPALEEVLLRKRGKSHSGVLVVTVFFGPGEFSCPKDCYYCPNQPGIARSYLLREPGVLRGFRNEWDPIRQFNDRASALEANGHTVDKIELIILGGTFSFYPKRYAEQFLAASYYAANTYFDSPATARDMGSLEEEITANETARCRIIGVTVETRPDYITQGELRRFRALGVTRVQLGIQHLDDDILNLINRECPTAKTVEAIRRLLDAGFKVDAHWMPDLPGSSYEKDLEMFQTLLSDDNESFQVDQWKVYPTATVPYTRIAEWHREGRYKPYAEVDGGALMVRLLLYIMEHCPYRIRLNRIVRDIPSDYITGGERRVNLRQMIEREMRARGVRCHDIRERECKGHPIDRADTRLCAESFCASGGTEHYLSVENADRSQLYGHLRLRLPGVRGRSAVAWGPPEPPLVPALAGAALIRELHTYGRLVAVSSASTAGASQHVGVGTQLMREAETIAAAHGFARIAVIAGVGVRRYYARLGYRLEDTYMVKTLLAPGADSSSPALSSSAAGGGGAAATAAASAIIPAELVDQDDDNENENNSTGGGFFSAVKSFFGLGGGGGSAERQKKRSAAP